MRRLSSILCQHWQRRWLRTIVLFMNALFLVTVLSSTVQSTPLAESQTDARVEVLTQTITPEVWFETGRAYYQQGQFAEAARLLEQAAQAFQTQQQSRQHAITLSNLSLVYQDQGHLDAARTVLQQSLDALDVGNLERLLQTEDWSNLSTSTLQVLAPTLNITGRLDYLYGDPQAALQHWQQAAGIYESLNDMPQWFHSQINQIQALQALGLNQQALSKARLLECAMGISPNTEAGTPNTDCDHVSVVSTDIGLQVRLLSNLGDALRTVGKFEQSERVLKRSLAIADNHSPNSVQTDLGAIHLSLGNTYLALGDRETERQAEDTRQGLHPWQLISTETFPDEAQTYYEAAQTCYEAALEDESPGQSAVNTQIHQAARLNLLGLMTRRKVQALSEESVISQWRQLNADLAQAPMNRQQVYAMIQLARQGSALKQLFAQATDLTWNDIIAVLEQAQQQAIKLSDDRAQAYALGNLGSLYEYLGWVQFPTSTAPTTIQYWRQQAQTLTTEALLKTQSIETPDIAYLWQWQWGRIQVKQGQKLEAIANYRQAAATLQAVRSNLLTVDSEVQFSFRDNVEPVYRELADLLLQADKPSQDALKEVISLIDNIQLAELESFLQCNLTGTVELTQADIPDTSAVLYTVILADRLEVIVQVPRQLELQHHRVRQSYAELETTLTNLRRELEKEFITSEGEAIAAEVYTWLLQPQEDILSSNNIDTLVFVLDSSLRNIPPAALRDAQGQYLVEKYAIALTPRLQLQTPQSLSPSDLDVLFFGLAKIAPPFKQRFGPLPFVKKEAQQVNASLSSQIFLNDAFTSTALDEALQSKPSNIIHFATHGEFSSDPEETFILAWDKQINSTDLNLILRNTPANFNIELLVLSACKTANGDNRATLGLAGLALQAGAQSTVASLWTVDDQATADFVGAFYQALTDGSQSTSRAEALRIAQLTLLNKYQAPTYWAPFVLVGNWL